MLPLLGEGVHRAAFAIPSLPRCHVWVSFCPHSMYLSKVCESWWLPGLSSLIFQLLRPREELGVARDSHGVAALAGGHRASAELSADLGQCCWKGATARRCGASSAWKRHSRATVAPPEGGRQGGTVLLSPGYPRALSPPETR